MDYEFYNKIRKGNLNALRDLQESELPWAYFVCYHITGNTGQAAELLVRAWTSAFKNIFNSDECIRCSFANCLSREIFIKSKSLPSADDMFASVPIPQISQCFQVFVEAIDRMESVDRTIYWLSTFGDLETSDVSELLNLSLSDAKKYMNDISSKALPQVVDGQSDFQRIMLSTQFRSSDKKAFDHITIPPLLYNSLEYESMRVIGKGRNKINSNKTRKDSENMKPTAKPTGKSTQPNRRAAAKKKKTIIISCVAAVLAIALIVTLVVVIKKANAPTPTVTTSYKVDEVTVGNVSTTISGSGSLTPIKSETLTAADLLAPIEAKIAEVTAISDEGVLTLTIYSLTEDGADYEITNVKIIDFTNYEATEKTEEYTIGTTDKIYTVANGTLDEIESTEIVVGDKLVIYDASEEFKNLIVYHAESEGSQAQSSSTGNGSANGGYTGSMPSIEDVTIPEIAHGTIKTVNVQVGDTVEAGDVIAVIVFENEETRNILAPYDAVILEWYLGEGDEVADETSVAMFMGTDGYKMTISVDENNISLVELGQDVEISIDASNEEMPTGKVTDISYNGSASGSTTAYKLTVTFDYVEGTYPGMSVSAEVVIEDSGEGLLVPVSAVQTSGDTKYVYLAPSGAKLADVYEDGDIDVSKLTKVTVTTGMSDGSYIMIESGNLSEGDLVVVITRTSTLTGSEGSDDDGRGGMSGFPGGSGSFPGGSFPGGSFPGGDLPEGFDPSQFGGGFPFGN